MKDKIMAPISVVWSTPSSPIFRWFLQKHCKEQDALWQTPSPTGPKARQVYRKNSPLDHTGTLDVTLIQTRVAGFWVPVGFQILYCHTPSDRFHLMELWIHPWFRKRGLGHQAVQFAVLIQRLRSPSEFPAVFVSCHPTLRPFWNRYHPVIQITPPPLYVFQGGPHNANEQQTRTA